MALWTVEKMSHFVLADVAGGLRGRFLSDGLRGCADGFRAETVFDAGRGAPDIYAEHRREVGRETEGVFHVRSSLPKRSDYGSSCRRLVPERVDGEPRGQRILLQCRWGVLPMRSLFSHSTIARPSADGDLRMVLRDIVANERSSHPLSDQKISEEFARRGVNLSRRTVARFRQELGIPSASERRYR